MKTISGVVLLATLLAACNTGQKQEGTTTEKASSGEEMAGEATITEMNLDLESSQVLWKGEMLGLYSHNGVIDIQSGSLKMKGTQVADGEFVINMMTITPTDDAYSEERPKERLVGHLASDDFFAVESYPTATFVITGVEGDKVTGDLTIRGITHSETFEDVEVAETGSGYKVTGKLVFDRTKYDVSFQMPVADRVLNDDIEIEIELMASA